MKDSSLAAYCLSSVLYCLANLKFLHLLDNDSVDTSEYICITVIKRDDCSL